MGMFESQVIWVYLMLEQPSVESVERQKQLVLGYSIRAVTSQPASQRCRTNHGTAGCQLRHRCVQVQPKSQTVTYLPHILLCCPYFRHGQEALGRCQGARPAHRCIITSRRQSAFVSGAHAHVYPAAVTHCSLSTPSEGSCMGCSYQHVWHSHAAYHVLMGMPRCIGQAGGDWLPQRWQRGSPRF